MKNVVIFLILISGPFLGYSQSSALTKEETVNYINKKANEIIGHYRTIPMDNGTGSIKYYYTVHDVRLNGDNLTITQERRNTANGALEGRYYPKTYHEQKHVNVFNPAHIISIEKFTNFTPGEPIGTLKITLKGNTGQQSIYFYGPTELVTNQNHQYWDYGYNLKEYPAHRVTSSSNVMYLSYLQSDEGNLNKIKKALEYLRDLLKAEDDPFGGG